MQSLMPQSVASVPYAQRNVAASPSLPPPSSQESLSMCTAEPPSLSAPGRHESSFGQMSGGKEGAGEGGGGGDGGDGGGGDGGGEGGGEGSGGGGEGGGV